MTSSVNFGSVFKPIIPENAVDANDKRWRLSPGTGLENLKPLTFMGKTYTVVRKEERNLSFTSGTRWLAIAASIFSFGIVPLCFSSPVKDAFLGKQFRLIVKEEANTSTQKTDQQGQSTFTSTTTPSNPYCDTASTVTFTTTSTPSNPYCDTASTVTFTTTSTPASTKNTFIPLNDLFGIGPKPVTEFKEESLDDQFADLEDEVSNTSRDLIIDEVEKDIEKAFAKHGVMDSVQDKIWETFRNSESKKTFRSKISRIQNQNKYPPIFTSELEKAYDKFQQK